MLARDRSGRSRRIMSTTSVNAFMSATASTQFTSATVDAAISDGLQKLGLKYLKDKQQEAILCFLEKDTFVSLPTGYGKSIIYALLPYIFDTLRGPTASHSIVVCISPLTSIMVDQHAKFSPRGLKTDFVGEAQCDHQAELRVLRGESQLVYISPENLLNDTKFRKMLLRQVYKDNLVAVVVDEAHCIQTWGDNFRFAFAEIGNIRSLIPTQVNIMALTATTTQETLKIVTDRLALKNPSIVALSPQRANIFYKVNPAVTLEQLAEILEDEFAEKRTNFPKTVIFCRRYQDCSNLYLTLRRKMGHELMEPTGYPDISEFRMVEIYTRVSKPEKRDAIITSFSTTNSNLRLVIATIAFGMGIDVPDIRRIMHWGLPDNLEEYVQETGRAGRDGGDAFAVLFEGKQGQHASKGMKAYVNNKDQCRRHFLFQDFIAFCAEELKDCHNCKCCDVCASCCNCSKCKHQ